MNTFEITIQRAHDGVWPVVVRHQPGPTALTTWAHGAFNLDLRQLAYFLPADPEYGILLGQRLFCDEVRDAFGRAASGAQADSELLRVLLIIEAEDLRTLHWEQLCAPFEGGRWDYLLLNQHTPFSLYLPSQIERRFPPIGRRDLRALLLVAAPEDVDVVDDLDPFDVPGTVAALSASLGGIPHDVLATSVEGAVGVPSLNALCEQLTTLHYTLLFIVCHGRYRSKDGETKLYLPEGGNRKPITGSELILRLSRLKQTHGLPHFTFLSTCESADPRAENGLGGLGQRLVRELGMPAVLAMTEPISIVTAHALSTEFCTRLEQHGEVDRALAEALAGLQGRYDVTVPALFSRLGGRPLFSHALDRPLSAAEIRYGLDQMADLLEARAPVLTDEFQAQSTKIQSALGADMAHLSPEARREFETSLAAVNQLASQALDLSFNAIALGQEPPEYDPRSPFRGLYPFVAQDREFFFGRQPLIDELAGRLNEHNFLAVLGPSGCGKSSVVLAGLVPSLGVPMAYMTPGSDPLAQLETILQAAPPESVLVVDQFEELFTLCTDEAQRKAFLERLLSAIGKMRVVITMRADFLGECAAYPGLRSMIGAHQVLVGPMSAAELRRAMEQQADHVGLRFEAGLGEQILEDVRGEPGAMPLLQHAMLLLWQRRHGRWLRWEEYTAIGGIREAIAHTAEEVYAGLGEHERVRMRDICIRLTRPPDVDPSQEGARYTRRRVKLEELVPAGAQKAATTVLVKHLADARLVVTRQREETGEVEVEVAHEALIQYWPRLRKWLDENRADILLREALTQAARDWESLDRDPGALYRGARLAQANEWAEDHPGELNILEQEFLTSSQKLARGEEAAREAQRQRELTLAQEKAEVEHRRAEEQARARSGLQRLSIGLAIIFVLAVAAAIFALVQREAAIDNAAEAEVQRATAVAERNVAATAQANAEWQARLSRAGELAASARSQFDQDLNLGLLLGVEAYRTADTLQTGQALFQAWTEKPELIAFLQAHKGLVSSVAWSPEGRLATGSFDSTVIVWDLESGKSAQTLQQHSAGVWSVGWSPDGRLASGSADGTVIVWDLESGQPAQTQQASSQVHSVAWSLDGRLASGSADGTVIVWDLDSGQPAQTLQGHSNAVWSVAWSPEGRLASGSENGTVIVWDLESGQPAHTLQGHSLWVHSLAWSLDGRLASGSWDYTVIVWDLESSQPAQTLQEHSQTVYSVAWSPEGRLASGSEDGTIILWDLESGQPAQTLQAHNAGVWSVAWSPEGRLASGSFDSTVIVWDPESGQPAQILDEHDGAALKVAWSPDGRLASGSADGTIIVWDLEGGQPTRTLQGHSGAVWGVAWSRDGLLASGSEDGTVHVWDLESNQPDLTLQDHSNAVYSVAWSPDGRLASSSCGEIDAAGLCIQGHIVVWDLEKGLPAQILQGHAGTIFSVAWSPDGILASGSEDRTAIVWNLESDQPAQTLQGHVGPVTSVAWSPDGHLASGSFDDSAIVWDLENGEPAQVLQGHGHKEGLWSVAWSPDGRMASGSADGTILIWDLTSGQPAQSEQRHSQAVLSLAWSPDGRLASGSADYKVRVWDISPELWVEQICQRAGRNFTQAEWAQYFSGEAYRKTCPQWPAEE